jgi:hypothetical protein
LIRHFESSRFLLSGECSGWGPKRPPVGRACRGGALGLGVTIHRMDHLRTGRDH